MSYLCDESKSIFETIENLIDWKFDEPEKVFLKRLTTKIDGVSKTFSEINNKPVAIPSVENEKKSVKYKVAKTFPKAVKDEVNKLDIKIIDNSKAETTLDEMLMKTIEDYEKISSNCGLKDLLEDYKTINELSQFFQKEVNHRPLKIDEEKMLENMNEDSVTRRLYNKLNHNNDDDEIEEIITDEPEQLICPLTKKTIVEKASSKKCSHIYEKNAILNYIKQVAAMGRLDLAKNAAKCPVVGCQNTDLMEKDLTFSN
ncbi:hypothetical protein SNEBB_005522 [Seison nebaliae]|nr:hypothetical protein SNEBB_005522 [Seison nebaliae]